MSKYILFLARKVWVNDSGLVLAGRPAVRERARTDASKLIKKEKFLTSLRKLDIKRSEENIKVEVSSLNQFRSNEVMIQKYLF